MHKLSKMGDYLVLMMGDILENGQSEFLQLLWQVAGLAMLLCVGSRQGRRRSHGGEDRQYPACDPHRADPIFEDIDSHSAGRHAESGLTAMLHSESRTQRP